MSTVLILGAASDMARAIARAYAKAGRAVILAARRHERLASDVADLGLRYGVAACAVEFDVLDVAGHARFLDALGELPDTVISVAGFMGEQAQNERDPEAATLVMRSNYVGPAAILGEAAQRMTARGSGVIIGISSVAGERGRARNYVYGSAKAGFTAFLSGLRNRLHGSGVRVITVLPGYVATRMTEGMATPRLLTAEPAEVADAILAAEAKGRDVIYVRPIWWLVMTVIRAIPERFFKRMRI
ncbi:MAG: SDR family oxidoreductase [Alphaproteobacteria bacterium]|nr:SDR family oxidoreductase [Alphaproteobacteria bacterium]